MSALEHLLNQAEELSVTATINGTTWQVDQYLNPFTCQQFWLYGEQKRRGEPDGITFALDRDWLFEDLFGHGFDPDFDGWYWYHHGECRCPLCRKKHPVLNISV